MGLDLKNRFNSLKIRLNLFLLNSLIDKQTRIKEYGGKIFFHLLHVSMVEKFLICYIKNWKYDGKKNPKKAKQSCSFIREFRLKFFFYKGFSQLYKWLTAVESRERYWLCLEITWINQAKDFWTQTERHLLVHLPWVCFRMVIVLLH